MKNFLSIHISSHFHQFMEFIRNGKTIDFDLTLHKLFKFATIYFLAMLIILRIIAIMYIYFL